MGNPRTVDVPVTVIDPTKREFRYDAAGNLTEELEVVTGQKTRYAYDAFNRLIKVSGSPPVGGVPDTEFLYDGEGKRITTTEGGATTTFLYDGLLPLLERQGGTTTRNLWGLSYGGGIGGLIARTTSAGTLYPLYDGSGNILAWTDSNGAVVSTTAYTSFGEIIAQTGPVQPYGFSTKPYSAATGLSYFGARYYRPDLGRWLTPDPLGMVDGPNLYQYVGNNPVSFLDPWGSTTVPSISGPQVLADPIPPGGPSFPVDVVPEPLPVPIGDIGLGVGPTTHIDPIPPSSVTTGILTANTGATGKVKEQAGPRKTREIIRHPDGRTTEIETRGTTGRDGAGSRIVRIRNKDGNTIAVWHEVRDAQGRVIHRDWKGPQGTPLPPGFREIR